MQTTITARHVEISEALRERATTVAERLETLARRPVDLTVVFETEGLVHVAELRLHLAHGELLVARGEADDHRTALDRAEDKLRRQVARASDALRRPRSSSEVSEL